MFGGTAFMVDGRMCVKADNGRLLCRVNPARHDELVERYGARTLTKRGREYRGWILMDEEHVTTNLELGRWITIALNYTAQAGTSRAKGNPRT
jgi:hypothetical protein